MRNIQQKIIAIFYLLVVISLSFFAPKYSNYSIRSSNKPIMYSDNSNNLELVSIWTTNKVDWFKFGYIFFLISLFFILLFYFYRNKSNPDVNSPTFKRKVKRELKFFVFGVLAFGIFLGFIEGFNLYQENRKNKIEGEIKISLVDFAKKVKEKYPEYKNVDDIELAKKAVEKYPEYKDKVVFDDEIKENKIDPDTFLMLKEYTKKINQLSLEKDGLFFFVRDGYIKSILLFLSIEILILYILRFGFYSVRSLNNYLKEN